MKTETAQGAHEAAVELAGKAGAAEAFGQAAFSAENLGDLGEDLARARNHAVDAYGRAAFLNDANGTVEEWQKVLVAAHFAAFWYGVAYVTVDAYTDNPVYHLLVPAIAAAEKAAEALAKTAVAAAAAACGVYDFRGV